VPAPPPEPQPPPPEEGDGATPTIPPVTPTASAAQVDWDPISVPSVFDPVARARNFPGSVRRYRLNFVAPRTPRGFRWLLHFDGVRRNAAVLLNGRRIGASHVPYVPFTIVAKGLRAQRTNGLTVIVDNRKNPQLPEGWWNWGGIVRSVHLVPAGRANLADLGLMSSVRCRGPARRCRAKVIVDGLMRNYRHGSIKPVIDVSLRSPTGRRSFRRVRLRRQHSRRRHIRFSVRVRSPILWSPDNPQLYGARIVVRLGGSVQQVVRMQPGLREVRVKRGRIYLNNRPINLRGASIHEDMPNHGTALTAEDMQRITSDLKAVHANVTRAHYLLNDSLLSMFDRAGIMVWSQAPIWHRDRLLGRGKQRVVAYRQVEGTVGAARNHPSVIAHSVGNELSYTPDAKFATGFYERSAARKARRLDPTVPIAIDVKTGLDVPRQHTYDWFDAIGLNQYFGWYNRSRPFDQLPAYLARFRSSYRRQALAITEFGAEARSEEADAPADKKGGYAFQRNYVIQNLNLVDRTPWLSGAIYWTLREFEIFPGWTGGAGPREGEKTRHTKGLLTYSGVPKPAWSVARDYFSATPLYAR
jgi:beta-galactosidase